jgi:dolichol-phosphate mannosyltransferase
LEMLQGLLKHNKNIKIIDFSRNFWHQIAITAWIDISDWDVSVIMDTDLQDQPEVVIKMVGKWKEWYNVVYGRRRKRKDTFFKKFTAKVFYRILKKLSNIDIPLDTWDFRLMDRKVMDEMRKLREHSRFMRWLTSWVGFKQTFVEFDRDERKYGETNYPLSKMLKFALDGITSFSYKPLKVATYVWFLSSFLSFLYILYIIFGYFFLGNWYGLWRPTIVIAIMFFWWLQLIILWIIWEYIWRIYTETQDRPLYVVNKIYNG